MATIQQEIMSIAEAQGYEGKSSGTIAEAVNALGSVIGGGGEGDAGVVFVDFTANQSGKFDASLTNKEICDLADSGILVVGRAKSVESGGYRTDYYYYSLSYAIVNKGSNTYDIDFVGMSATGAQTGSVSLLITAIQNTSNADDGTEYASAYKQVS